MRLAAVLVLALAPAGAAADMARMTAEAAGTLEVAAALLAVADSAPARLGALGEAARAMDAGLAAMREAQRRAVAEEAGVSAALTEARTAEAAARVALRVAASAPPAAWAAMPGGPLAQARGAAFAAGAAGLRAGAVARWDRARAAAEADRAVQAEARAALHSALAEVQARRAALSEALRRRQPAPASGGPDIDPARDALRAFAATLASPGPRRPAPRPAAPGALPPPAPGRVATAFNAPDPLGQPIPGVSLVMPAGTLVRAPTVAVVRYAGPLPGHGTVVILETAPGRLLLLAGLAAARVEAGAVTPAGALVGHVGVMEGPSEEFLVEAPLPGGALSETTLYVETRVDGIPVDPASWFGFE